MVTRETLRVTYHHESCAIPAILDAKLIKLQAHITHIVIYNDRLEQGHVFHIHICVFMNPESDRLTLLQNYECYDPHRTVFCAIYYLSVFSFNMT